MIRCASPLWCPLGHMLIVVVWVCVGGSKWRTQASDKAFFWKIEQHMTQDIPKHNKASRLRMKDQRLTALQDNKSKN